MTTEETSFKRYRQGYRRIHMDFHNPEFIDDVGHHLDAAAYAQTLKDAAVNSLVSFAKGHHGNCYYPTEAGHQHPALQGDMLGDILRACQAQDISTFIYYSVAWDKHIETEHPEWCCRTREAATIPHEIWSFICLNSPYKREVVFPQLRELITRYNDTDFLGFWLDLCWMPPEGCYCSFCQRKFQHEYGHSLFEASEAERFAFLRRSVHDFIAEAKRVVKALNPALLVARNQVWLTGRPLYENASPDLLRPGEYDDLWYVPDFMVTETGIAHSLYHASLWARYFRGFGKPFEVVFTRFVDSWGSWDVLPAAHLKTLSAQIACHGGVIGCGDQGYVHGPLDPGVYDTIGEAFRYVAARERWFLDKREAANLCILADNWGEGFNGLVHMLTQLQYPFAVRDFKRALVQGLDDFALVILPAPGPLSAARRDLLVEYVRRGGRLLADPGDSGLDETTLAALFGVQYAGLSPYSIGYLDMTALAEESTLPNSPLLIERPFAEVIPSTARPLVRWKMPRVESTGTRYWRHPNAPPAAYSDYPAVTVHPLGTGQAMLVSTALFADYWARNHWYLKEVLRLLLAETGFRPVATVVPHRTDLEINVTRDEDSLQVHLITLQAAPKMQRASIIEDTLTLAGLVLEVAKAAIGPVTAVTLQPRGLALSWQDRGDHLAVELPAITGYEVVEIR